MQPKALKLTSLRKADSKRKEKIQPDFFQEEQYQDEQRCIHCGKLLRRYFICRCGQNR